MLTKEQLQAAAKAIDGYTDRIRDGLLRSNPRSMSDPAIAGAFVVAGSIQVALLAMAETAPKQEDRT